MKKKLPKWLQILALVTLLPVFLGASNVVGSTREAKENDSVVVDTPADVTPKELPIAEDRDYVAKISSGRALAQGSEITVNGQKKSAAWIQWQQGKSVRTLISDTAAMEIFGLELLSTNNPEEQPVLWFANAPSNPLVLDAKFVSPYRYLDLTELAGQVDWQIKQRGNSLTIDTPPAQIKEILHFPKSWGEQIVIDLDRPTFWQVSENNVQGAIKIEAIASSTLVERFTPPPPSVSEEEEMETATIFSTEEELSSQVEVEEPSPTDNQELISRISEENTSNSFRRAKQPPFIVESDEERTKLLIDLPPGHGVRVLSSTNPHSLIVTVQPNTLVERDILWAPGIRWRQKFISVNTNPERTEFPVVWLEIDPSSPEISLQPITSNSDSLVGTEPLLTTARREKVAAAINGGFFNRNNKLPLGAIRQNSRWLSGPILGRGAIAWNDAGKVKIGRLALKETLTTSGGKYFPIDYLNSGYLTKGISRYTSEWGSTYTPLSNNETIVLVENNRVTNQLAGGLAGEISFPIPTDGYLLTIRGDNTSALDWAVGTKLNLRSTTVPSDFGSYPHILGAGPLLLNNGEIVLYPQGEKFSAAFIRQAASRSAIATTSNGKLIIAAVHKRPGGRGPTLLELAKIMQNLGAIDALNLDGGSSTSLYLGGQLIDRSPVTAARVHNGLGIFFR